MKDLPVLVLLIAVALLGFDDLQLRKKVGEFERRDQLAKEQMKRELDNAQRDIAKTRAASATPKNWFQRRQLDATGTLDKPAERTNTYFR